MNASVSGPEWLLAGKDSIRRNKSFWHHEPTTEQFHCISINACDGLLGNICESRTMTVEIKRCFF